MFIDTSIVVAVLSDEVNGDQLARLVANSINPMTSAVVILEASTVLSTKLVVDPSVAEKQVMAFLATGGVEIIDIDVATTSLAVQAFQRYGKGRGHPARLNMADCLSYACAKQHRVPLLYVGNDFAQTDLA